MRVFLMLAITVFVLSACNKSSDGKSKPYPDTLPGKWHYVEYYASAGGPGSWYTVNPVDQWIDLQQNGRLSSNLVPFKDADSWLLPDSSTIKFMIPSKPDGYLLFQYRIDTVQAALILSPLNPLCIEGCAIKFKR